MSVTSEVRKPPPMSIGIFGWISANLFSTRWNTVFTFLAVYLIWAGVTPVLEWAVLNADISGTDRSACVSGGACWVFIKMRFSQFMYGFYTDTERWRVDAVFLLPLALWGLRFLPRFRWPKFAVAALILIYPVAGYIVLSGGVLGLEVVETSLWGGLMLTIVVSSAGIVASLPLGILLALGRRSGMPAVRLLSTGFIELWRGVPLISVLFMTSVMLPLFLPEGMNFDKLLRALIGVALFSSAYMAEVVRGGLQAVPRGQYEAAAALGLGYTKTMALIVMPQALKMVIPGIVNTFIGLFKDTTLVYIIGLFDLLGIIQSALTDPNWLGFATEGYLFAALVFWLFTFSMSRVSLRLERNLNTEN